MIGIVDNSKDLQMVVGHRPLNHLGCFLGNIDDALFSSKQREEGFVVMWPFFYWKELKYHSNDIHFQKLSKCIADFRGYDEEKRTARR